MEKEEKSELVSRYLPIIDEYENSSRVQKWQTQSKKITDRYEDHRSTSEENSSKYNVLWSNVETLKPSLYSNTPKPEVAPRHKKKDELSRLSASVLEKSISYFLGQNYFGSTMRQAVFDYLITARGVVWARYVPKFRDIQLGEESTQITDDAVINDEDDEPLQEVYDEDVFPDYVHWQDFGHNIARTWEEVTVVWRKAYLTRKQLKKRFGEKIGSEVGLDAGRKMTDEGENRSSASEKACVYEIWDKDELQVIWINRTCPNELDVKDDPLKLDKFFPCPKPVYCNLTNDSLIPVPDYAEYQDQADQLDKLTSRIAEITKSVKVAGVCAGDEEALTRLLSEGTENKLVPVQSWTSFAGERGGLKGTFELLPMQEIAQTLLTLYDCRERVKADLYEISGMGDIIRGASDPNETATAQTIKSNYITLRLSDRQKEIQRFARNVIDIIGQIIARHFSVETLKRISGVELMTDAEKQQAQMQMQMQPQQPGGQPPQLPPEIESLMRLPTWEQVDALLKSPEQFCFNIDIETDSTIAGDEQQEKTQRLEFLGAVGGFMREAIQAPPELAPLVGELLMFGVRAFRVGRDLEGSFEEALQAMKEKAQKAAQAPPQPSEEQIKAQTEQAKMQLEQQKAQASMQTEQSRMQAEAQKSQQDAQLEMMLARSKQQSDEQMKAAELQAEARAEQQRLAFDSWKAQLEAQTQKQIAEMQASIDLQRLDREDQRQREQNARDDARPDQEM